MRFYIVILILLGSRLVVAQESKTSLDPVEGKYLIVSTVFDLVTLPKLQDRISIFSKLSNFGKDPIGYGLSLKRFQTAIRPQIYWSMGNGDGGFFTFGNFDFRARHRYVMTLVVKPGEFLSLYIQERSKDRTDSLSFGKSLSKVSFLGGHELKGISTPKNNSIFNYKITEDSLNGAHANVLGAFVATPEKLKDSIDKMTKLLEDAPESLVELFDQQDIQLWEVSATQPMVEK